MLKLRIWFLLSAATLGGFMLLLNGCTAIGYGVGRYLDSKSTALRITPRQISEQLETGAAIEVQHHSGLKTKGLYVGTNVLAEQEYARQYQIILHRAPDSLRLPALGDTLTLQLKPARSSAQTQRVFGGFDLNFENQATTAFLNCTYLTSGAQDKIKLDRIHLLSTSDHREIDLSQIEDFIAAGGLDETMAITVKNAQGRHKIALVDIETIAVQDKKVLARLLGSAGFVVDLILFIILKEPTRGSSSRINDAGG